MATRSSRSKTTAAKATAETTEPKVEETPAVPAEETPEAPAEETPEAPAEEKPEESPVPAAGALEPPAAPAVPAEAEADKPIAAGELGAERIKHTHGLIIDATTQQPPNPDTLFLPAAGEAGSVYQCTARLLQVMYPGDAWSSSQLLVMPRGQMVSQARAEQVTALIREQIAGAGLEAVDLTADSPKLGDDE